MKAALQVEPQLIPLGLLVTVPLPDFVTVNVLVVRAKVAVTAFAAVILTVQVVAVPVQAPDHPENAELADAAAVRVTEVPLLKLALHVLAQLTPAGLLVTVPAPVPASVVVRAYWMAVKVAVTDCA